MNLILICLLFIVQYGRTVKLWTDLYRGFQIILISPFNLSFFSLLDLKSRKMAELVQLSSWYLELRIIFASFPLFTLNLLTADTTMASSAQSLVNVSNRSTMKGLAYRERLMNKYIRTSHLASTTKPPLSILKKNHSNTRTNWNDLIIGWLKNMIKINSNKNSSCVSRLLFKVIVHEFWKGYWMNKNTISFSLSLLYFLMRLCLLSRPCVTSSSKTIWKV